MEYKISELNDHHPGTELKAKLFYMLGTIHEFYASCHSCTGHMIKNLAPKITKNDLKLPCVVK